MAELIENILDETDVQTLLEYIAVEDERSDIRPDVSSKHPRWDVDDWPQHIVEKGLNKLYPNGFVMEEITFQDTRIGLKPHTDNGSLPGTVGQTVMFCLHAEPSAETLFFNNYWQGWRHSGAFFTRQHWTPFQYKLPGKDGELVYVEDLRILHQGLLEGHEFPEFDVDSDFIKLVADTIKKRSLPRDEDIITDKETGFIQAGPRVNDYRTLSNYQPEAMFSEELHQKWLKDVPLEDLHGLTLETVLEWKLGAGIIFNREQLHASSSNHSRKIFMTAFCHSL
jgi:hypothetical protein